MINIQITRLADIKESPGFQLASYLAQQHLSVYTICPKPHLKATLKVLNTITIIYLQGEIENLKYKNK